MVSVQGRRLPDTEYGSLPQGFDELKPGDYWKYLAVSDGLPLKPMGRPESLAGNLTGTVWGYYSPDGNGIGTLVYHTVREHEDGTISVIAGDGSSNSILHSGAQKKSWHGYISHGVWQEC